VTVCTGASNLLLARADNRGPAAGNLVSSASRPMLTEPRRRSPTYPKVLCAGASDPLLPGYKDNQGMIGRYSDTGAQDGPHGARRAEIGYGRYHATLSEGALAPGMWLLTSFIDETRCGGDPALKTSVCLFLSYAPRAFV
jgi:hypothetical protein